MAGLVALAASASLSACSAEGEDGPEGYQRVSAGIVQLDVPGDLSEVDAVENSIWDVVYQDADVDAGGAGVTTQVLVDSQRQGATTAMDGPAYLLTLANMGTYDEFRTVELEDRPQWEQDADEERGADEREFVRHRYTWAGPDGTEYEAVTWGVWDGDTTAAMIQYVSADLDEDIARTIDESIVVD